MDNKKIFDILPPQKQEVLVQKKRVEAPVIKKAPKKEKEVPQGKPGLRKSGPRLSKIFIFFVFLLVAFVLASNFIFNRAEIKIWPKVEAKNLNENITVATAKTSLDVQTKSIPGKIFEEEKTVSQEFSATGQTTEGQKATGKIRIFNNYSDASQVLIKNTRLISAEGKLFRTTEKVVVPGGTYDKGKLQPGSIDVAVAADQPGEGYNIGPSTFSIPGFVGTAKYTAFYGKSSEAMQGGLLGQVPQILSDDLDSAKKNLTAQAAQEGKTLLKNKIPSDFLLLDEAIYQEVISATSSLAAGQIAKTFVYQVRVRVKTLAFSGSDLENLSRELLLLDFPPGKKIQAGTLSVGYDFGSLDLNSGKMILRANLSAKIYSDVNENNFSQSLAGKSLPEANQIITAQPEITKVQIKSWPFWAKSIPKEQEKVGIKLILD